MGIGVSVFLLAVGAILAFAVTDSLQGIDLTVVGYILIAAGAIGLAMTTLVFGRRRNDSVTGGTERVVTRERDVY